MEIQERKNLIYQTLRMRNKLTHNELWRVLQEEFKKEKDSFSNKTFEKTLKEMVDQKLIYKEKEKNSKLGKTWYFPIIDFSKIEQDVMRNLETKVRVYDDELHKFEEKFENYDLYEKARRLSRFHILVTLVSYDIQWFSEIYKNPKMKKRYKEVENMKKELKMLFEKSKTERDEIRQLVIKNFESDEQVILSEISP